MDIKASVTGLTDVAVETSQLCPGKCVAAIYNDWHMDVSLHMMRNVIFL
jgi:hypothetical protein